MTRALAALMGAALAMGCSGKVEPATTPDCGEGMGRADDGICYPLAGATTDSGMDDDSGAGGGDNGAGASGDGGSGDGGSGDGGSADGGSADGGSADAGSADGGSADGGSADGGSADAGSADGGSADGGSTGTATGVEITISGVINFEATTEAGANCNITSWVAEAIDETSGMPDRSSYTENDMQFVDCSNHPGGDLAYEVTIQADDSTDVAFFAFVDPDGDSATTDFRAASEANNLTITAGETYTDVDFIVPTELATP